MKTPRDTLKDYKRKDLPLDQAVVEIDTYYKSKVPKKQEIVCKFCGKYQTV